MSSNFQGGPVNLTAGAGPLRFEDAAEPVTAEGWSCVRCQRFYGKDERAARYCCHTDDACSTTGCQNRRDRHHIHCPACAKIFEAAHYAGLEQVSTPEAPSANCPLVGLNSDTYFFDGETLDEYCCEHDLLPSQLRLVRCAEHNPPTFDLEEWMVDYLPGEDNEMPGDRAEIQAVNDAVNAFVKSHSPISWMPDHKRRPTDADLQKLDAEYKANS